MKITLIKEHASCPYNCQTEKSIIDRVEVDQGHEYDLYTNSDKIIMVTEGEVEVCLDAEKPQTVRQAQMFYTGLGQHVKLTSTVKSTLLIFR